MTDHRVESLRQWIDDLDGQIGMLTEQRDMLVSALGVLDGSASETAAAQPAGMTVFVRDEPVGSPKAKQHHAKPRKKAAPGESKYDYAEVARVAVAAQRAGEPMARALAQRLGVTEAMGTYLVGEARRHGHEIPKGSTGARAKPKVTPLAAVADIETVNHPATGKPGPDPQARAFTPADTLKLLQGG